GATTVALVELITHRQPIRRNLGFGDDGDRRFEVRRLEDPAAPSREQRLHSIENCEVIVDAQYGDAGELHAVDIPSDALVLACRNDGGERNLDGKLRPAADR